MYHGTKIMREFYLKDAVARGFIGFVIGIGVATYLYGGKSVRPKKEEEKVDDTSLEYSKEVKMKYYRKA